MFLSLMNYGIIVYETKCVYDAYMIPNRPRYTFGVTTSERLEW